MHVDDEYSRYFQIRDEAIRDHANDGCTTWRLREPGEGALHEPFDAKKLFIERYAQIRAAAARHERQGVLIMAFDHAQAPIAEAWIEASLDRSRAAILGRHSVAHVMLPTDHDYLSLRHLAVLVRATSHTAVRIRFLDLHTGTGFADEHGVTLQGAVCDGPMFISIGRIRFAVLVTGEGELPGDPEAAYRTIPERILLEERRGAYARRPSGNGEMLHEATRVTSLPGPIGATARLLVDDEAPVGQIAIEGDGMTVTKDVGSSALNRGLLFGRYSRCDVRTGVDSDKISRVHLVLVRELGELLALDASS